jgi:hypothetical protein
VIVHVRADEPYRRRVLVPAALSRGPSYQWSSTVIEDGGIRVGATDVLVGLSVQLSMTNTSSIHSRTPSTTLNPTP